MKREILCSDCCSAALPKGRMPGTLITALQAAEEAHEHTFLLRGYLRASAICDRCSAQLSVGDPVGCLSIWSDLSGIKYYPWESIYTALSRGPENGH